MTEFLLIRHAETEDNKTGKFSGITDVSLNDTGRNQALRLAEILRNENIDYIYSSDLKRCVETGKSIIPKKDIIFSQNLREMDFGKWDGLTYDEIKEKFPDELSAWENDWTGYAVPGGEAFQDMSIRVLKEFEKILNTHKNNNSKIAIISHGGCIRTVLGQYIIGSLKDIWKFHIDNAVVSRMIITDDFIYLKSLNERILY